MSTSNYNFTLSVASSSSNASSTTFIPATSFDIHNYLSTLNPSLSLTTSGNPHPPGRTACPNNPPSPTSLSVILHLLCSLCLTTHALSISTKEGGNETYSLPFQSVEKFRCPCTFDTDPAGSNTEFTSAAIPAVSVIPDSSFCRPAQSRGTSPPPLPQPESSKPAIMRMFDRCKICWVCDGEYRPVERMILSPTRGIMDLLEPTTCDEGHLDDGTHIEFWRDRATKKLVEVVEVEVARRKENKRMKSAEVRCQQCGFVVCEGWRGFKEHYKSCEGLKAVVRDMEVKRETDMKEETMRMGMGMEIGMRMGKGKDEDEDREGNGRPEGMAMSGFVKDLLRDIL